jgi:hypothetical protein
MLWERNGNSVEFIKKRKTCNKKPEDSMYESRDRVPD